MAEFASNVNAKANAGLTTGIIGSAGWLLNGGLGNLFGGMGSGNCACSDNIPVSRYDMGKENEIAQLKSEKALLESTIYTDKKSLELYSYVDGRLRNIEAQIAGQAVWNASQTGIINCLQGQINEIMSLSKRIIPASSVCPAPMPQYNSFVVPTAPTTGA
jgi:hypothetical protein